MPDYSPQDVYDLAATIYAEAAREPRDGKIALAHTVKNRAEVADVPIQGVVYGKQQFSAFNPGPAFHGYADVAKGYGSKNWDEAVAVAANVLGGKIADPTKGATYYHGDYMTPSWAGTAGTKQTAHIGQHKFYTKPVSEVKAVTRAAARSQRDPVTVYDADLAKSREALGFARGRVGNAADARLADAWGYQDPTTTRGLSTPANTPMPGGLIGDPRNMRDISAGLLGGVAPPTDRPAGMGLAMPAPTPRASNVGRPGVPAPKSRPSPSMAPPSATSAAVQERMTGVPMSDRQITASIPDMPRESAMLSRTAPSINARPAMERPTAMADLSPSVQERMGGFPDVPAPTQRAELSPGVMERMDGFPSTPAPSRAAATGDLSPSVMGRMGGLLSMDAKAATMPGSLSNGLLADTPPSFGRPDAIAYADPVPSRPSPSVPSYQAPPASYQTPAFSTAAPQIDALGQPPIPGLQRTPQAPARPQYQAQAPQPPSYPAPRDVAPAPTIAGPVGRQRQVEAPERSNISGAADRNMAQVAASRALDTVADRGLFGGGFRGPTGVLGGAMLGGALGGIPGAAVGGLLGSETVRDALGLGGLERSGPHGSGQLSAGALAALNSGWGGFGNMTATQQLATSLARAQAEQKARQARGGLFGGWNGWGDFEGFDGWGLSGNEASSSAINGRTTSYRDGRTSMGGEGGFGSGSMSDSARSSAKGGGGLF